MCRRARLGLGFPEELSRLVCERSSFTRRASGASHYIYPMLFQGCRTTSPRPYVLCDGMLRMRGRYILREVKSGEYQCIRFTTGVHRMDALGPDLFIVPLSTRLASTRQQFTVAIVIVIANIDDVQVSVLELTPEVWGPGSHS